MVGVVVEAPEDGGADRWPTSSAGMQASVTQRSGNAALAADATATTGTASRLSPSSAAASESRSAPPRSPRRVMTRTTAGPLTLTEVVRAPA